MLRTVFIYFYKGFWAFWDALTSGNGCVLCASLLKFLSQTPEVARRSWNKIHITNLAISVKSPKINFLGVPTLVLGIGLFAK